MTVPLLGVSGMPVGVQIMGQPHADARVAGIARWLAQSVAPVKIGLSVLNTESTNAGCK